MQLRNWVADDWKKLDYRKVKPLTIVFTWFKPKPFILKPGVLNVKRLVTVDRIANYC